MKSAEANTVLRALQVALQAMEACSDEKLDALEEQLAALTAARKHEVAR